MSRGGSTGFPPPDSPDLRFHVSPYCRVRRLNEEVDEEHVVDTQWTRQWTPAHRGMFGLAAGGPGTTKSSADLLTNAFQNDYADYGEARTTESNSMLGKACTDEEVPGSIEYLGMRK